MATPSPAPSTKIPGNPQHTKVRFQPTEEIEQPSKEKAPRKTYLEKTLAKEYPGMEEETAGRILKAIVPLTAGEICAIAPGVVDHIKKKISNKRIPLDPNVSSNTVALEEEEEEEKSVTHYSCPLGYVKLTINGETFEALLDTGSMVNIIPEELAHHLGLVITEKPMKLKGIGGHHTGIIGIAERVEVLVGRVNKLVHFWVARGGVQFIVGKPFLMDMSATIKYNGPREESLSIVEKGQTYLVPILLPSHHKWETSLPVNIVTRDFLDQGQNFQFSK
jgi:hypothetical protein